jgi:hypothetical protein
LFVASAIFAFVPQTLAASTCTYEGAARPGKVLFRGELASVAIEPNLFQIDPSPRLFMGIRISNLTDQTIGVDLTRPFDIIYPNQIGLSSKDHREIVDERRLIIGDAPDGALRRVILADFHNHRLAEIQPKASLVYYREFFGGDRTNHKLAHEVGELSGSFLVMALDGRLLLTNGQAVVYHRFTMDADERVVAFALLPCWHTLTGREIIIRQTRGG